MIATDDPRHGSENAYVNLGCRCERCTTAHRKYPQQAEARRRWRARHVAAGRTAGGRPRKSSIAVKRLASPIIDADRKSRAGRTAVTYGPARNGFVFIDSAEALAIAAGWTRLASELAEIEAARLDPKIAVRIGPRRGELTAL